VAEGIVAWLVRDMRAPDGAFYSSLDADSEGHEGRFYVWDAANVRARLPPELWAVVAPHFGLDRAPNFEGHAWNLRIMVPLGRVAHNCGIALDEAVRRLDAASALLFADREARVHPARDDKILTSWNALAIAGLARAARACDQPGWAELAFAAADALKRTVWRDGRLLATRKDDRADLNAYLDDYAFLLAAVLELLQTRFRSDDFEWARALADALLAHFEDVARGGFYFTSHDHERLIHRTKPGHDNATPSGNGVAACALIALGHLAAQPTYVAAGERCVRVFASALAKSPGGYSTLLEANTALEKPPTLVIIGGDPATAAAWQRALDSRYRPNVMIFNTAGVSPLPDILGKPAPPTDGAVAWICHGTTCLPPVASLADVERVLAADSRENGRP
jgi:uncharacterized protein YyaL (SSP411 family)